MPRTLEPARLAAHYAHVARVYDNLAPSYDQDVGWSPQAARAKAAALAEVKRVTRSGDHLLDIGCGTGTEARMLARAGRRVTGIDVSAAMVAAARGRLEAAPGSLQFQHLAAAQADRLPRAAFDGAYSFYGVLDLEPALPDALAGIAAALKPGAPFVVGLLNPTVSYELLLYPLAGRFKGYRKSLQRPVRLRTMMGGGDAVDCYLHSPRAFLRQARPHFAAERVRGLHFLLPPPRGPLLRMPRLLRAVGRIEDGLGGAWPFRRLGYFTLMTLRRRP